VTEALRSDILAGRHPPGGDLPAERVLAAALGVSRPTLRSALRTLETEGLVRARDRSGYVVLDWRSHGSLALLPYLLRAADAELVAAFLALAAAQQERARTLDARAPLATTAFAEGDLAFARALVSAAANPAISLLFNSVAAVYAGVPALQAALLHDPQAVAATYPALAGLVRGGDPELARQLVRVALQRIDDVTLAAYGRLGSEASP
jgi:DNA-binding FadR family transcriptional regulator